MQIDVVNERSPAFEKVQRVFNFLKEHSAYNRSLQNNIYRGWLAGFNTPRQKVLALLSFTLNTQSQPALDSVAKFWKHVYERLEHDADCLNSFEAFTTLLNELVGLNVQNKKMPFDVLHSLLRRQPGWGNKTAALFAKSIYQIHNDSDNADFKFWSDVPPLVDVDRMWLPVDAVIAHIFGSYLTVVSKPDFKRINNFLHSISDSPEDMVLWDDLWFWGFITQKTQDKKRIIMWNDAKYLTLIYALQEKEARNTIEKLASDFIQILKQRDDQLSL